MQYLFSLSNNPFFNLAAEEFLMRKTNFDLVFLYINSPSIIIGKHQNTLAEINWEWINKHKIPVIRRLSGGGTVYHDEGNLNFCFIKNTPAGKQVNFRAFVDPVIQFLKTLGLTAKMGEKNELLSGNKKISGNAEHVFKNRVMHHGTLLFDSNLSNLEMAILPSSANISDKAVKSNRAQVENIKALIDYPKNTIEFAQSLYRFLMDYFGKGTEYQWKDDDLKVIYGLIAEKYSRNEWNYAYSPDYTLNNTIAFPNDWICTIRLEVKKNIIQSIRLEGNIKLEMQTALESLLIHQQHHPEIIQTIFKNPKLQELWKLISPVEFIKLFF